jgi:hypothetical protein
VKVFISSVITGFEAEREAAAEAARSLGFEVKLAEDFPALADSPQVACLAGVRWADVVVLLLGDRYGLPQASGLSATHEEYHEARDRRDVLAFVQANVTPEERQKAFIDEVQDYVGGRISDAFRTADELKSLVLLALHGLALRKQAGAADDSEITERARAALGHGIGSGGAVLSVTVASGPRQAVLRPALAEAPEFRETLLKEVLFGRSLSSPVRQLGGEFRERPPRCRAC